MKLTCRMVSIPFQSAFSHHRATRAVSESFWVEASYLGQLGIGEGCPRSYVTGETPESCEAFFERIAPLASTCIDDLPALQTFRKEHHDDILRNPSAWCAMELAMLDLLARIQGQSVEVYVGWPVLQGPFHYSGVLGSDVGGVFEGKLKAHVDLGFQDFKLKWGRDPVLNRSRFEALKALVPNAKIRIDANNCWEHVQEAIKDLADWDVSRVSQHDIWAIEEPLVSLRFEDLLEFSTLLDCRVILDEAVCNVDQLLPFLQHPDRFLLNLRVSKCGGLLQASEMAAACKDAGMGVIVGAQVGETSVLTRAALTIAEVLGKHCVAQEGAYGTYLLSEDMTQSTLMFGRKGLLRPHDLGLKDGFGLQPKQV